MSEKHTPVRHASRKEEQSIQLSQRGRRTLGVAVAASVALAGAGAATHNMLTKRNEVKPTTVEFDAPEISEQQRTVIADVVKEVSRMRDTASITELNGVLQLKEENNTLTIAATPDGTFTFTKTTEKPNTNPVYVQPDTRVTTLDVGTSPVDSTFTFTPDKKDTIERVNLQPEDLDNIIESLVTASDRLHGSYPEKPIDQTVTQVVYDEERTKQQITMRQVIGPVVTKSLDGTSARVSNGKTVVYYYRNGELVKIDDDTARMLAVNASVGNQLPYLPDQQ